MMAGSKNSGEGEGVGAGGGRGGGLDLSSTRASAARQSIRTQERFDYGPEVRSMLFGRGTRAHTCAHMLACMHACI